MGEHFGQGEHFEVSTFFEGEQIGERTTLRGEQFRVSTFSGGEHYFFFEENTRRHCDVGGMVWWVWRDGDMVLWCDTVF